MSQMNLLRLISYVSHSNEVVLIIGVDMIHDEYNEKEFFKSFLLYSNEWFYIKLIILTFYIY